MEAHIETYPNPALVTDEVQINIKNLAPNAAVTVSSYVFCDPAYMFMGYAHFYTDSNGKVSLDSATSYGGTYKGVLRNGILSSSVLLPSKKRDGRFGVFRADDALKTEISVFRGHKTQDELQKLHLPIAGLATLRNPPEILKVSARYRDDNLLGMKVLKRRYLASNVQRIDINENQIHGTLFIPSKKPPFNAVIDFSSRIGTCYEEKAALLANEGFLTFAPNFVDIKSEESMSEDYAGKVLEWIYSIADTANVGVLGSNNGCSLALRAILQHPKKIKTCALIGTLGDQVNANTTDSIQRLTIHDGVIHTEETPQLPDFSYFRFPKSVNFLLQIGSECPIAYKRDMEHFHQHLRNQTVPVEFSIVPGEGSIIDPPYSPQIFQRTAESSFGSEIGRYMQIEGGVQHKSHGESQKQAWMKLVDFLKETLGDTITTQKAKL